VEKYCKFLSWSEFISGEEGNYICLLGHNTSADKCHDFDPTIKCEFRIDV
jgi:hypothetical protein